MGAFSLIVVINLLNRFVDAFQIVLVEVVLNEVVSLIYFTFFKWLP